MAFQGGGVLFFEGGESMKNWKMLRKMQKGIFLIENLFVKKNSSRSNYKCTA